MKEYSTKDGRVVVIREATGNDFEAMIDLWNACMHALAVPPPISSISPFP